MPPWLYLVVHIRRGLNEQVTLLIVAMVSLDQTQLERSSCSFVFVFRLGAIALQSFLKVCTTVELALVIC
jgi:hypothetical protein